jgi:hypothetical protein
MAGLYHGGYKSRSHTAAAQAVSKSHENEKRRKSAARTCKWHDCQSGERQSEIRHSDLTGHTEGCACLPEEQWSEIRQNDLTGHAEGHACLSEKRQSEIQQTHWMGHAEGHASLSAEWQSEIRQTNLMGHAEGCAHLKRSNMQRMVRINLIYYCWLNCLLFLYLLSLITLQDK